MRLAAIRFAAVLLIVGIATPAVAGDTIYANRPQVVFPGPRGGVVHVSPFPMSSRSTAVWVSDPCWRVCVGTAGWEFARCLKAGGRNACRAATDDADLACQRACRPSGGPYLNITAY